jgi:sulfatase modifying factor 1
MAGAILAFTLASPVSHAERPAARRGARTCPAEMVQVHDFCIDRWEVSLVDAVSGEALSPYYPPSWPLIARVRAVWEVERELFGSEEARRMPLPDLPSRQRTAGFSARAVSAPAVTPQGYLSFYQARDACQNAGKRLCTEDEWVTACRGEREWEFPYGASYATGRCNVFRLQHPAFVLHGNTSAGHTDPRLNLVRERADDPLLRLTGTTNSCRSAWGEDAIFDMVGNLDEWIDDESGVFVGGFYSRGTTKGCSARIASHSPSYYDYSLGTRCCRNVE